MNTQDHQGDPTLQISYTFIRSSSSRTENISRSHAAHSITTVRASLTPLVIFTCLVVNPPALPLQTLTNEKKKSTPTLPTVKSLRGSSMIQSLARQLSEPCSTHRRQVAVTCLSLSLSRGSIVDKENEVSLISEGRKFDGPKEGRARNEDGELLPRIEVPV